MTITLKNYDAWKQAYPSQWDEEYPECCEEPDWEEAFCGCEYCFNCDETLVCGTCAMLDKYGL